jgi:hypothetical protein
MRTRRVIAGAVLVAALAAVGCSEGAKEADKFKDPGIKMYERPLPGTGGAPPGKSSTMVPKGAQ